MLYLKHCNITKVNIFIKKILVFYILLKKQYLSFIKYIICYI